MFIAALIVAVPLYLSHGHQWFFLDDWDFVTARSLTSVHDLFRPHNEHWSTAPIIVYRVFWHVFGLRYTPYELVVIFLHLTAAVLLRKIMLRSGVDTWIATCGAVLFVFLGSGSQNIVYAFQMSFAGSLVCGLAHLLFADHDGQFDRRDAIGVCFGMLGLLCSGVAVTMVIVVGLSVLLRRGWRTALLHVLPLAAAYAVWYVSIGHEGYSGAHASFSQIFVFTRTAIANAFRQMGHVPGVGLLLGLVLIAGLIVAWARMPFDVFRRQAAAPASLLAGTVIFSVISGYGRANLVLGIAAIARSSRYVHLIVAMTIPALAVAADALARRWRVLYPMMLLALLVGIPGNIGAIMPHGIADTAQNKNFVLALAHSPYAAQLPASLDISLPDGTQVSAGWLVAGARSGHIPSPGRVSPELAAATTLVLALRKDNVDLSTVDCQLLTHTVTEVANAHDIFVIRRADVDAHVPLPNGALSYPRTFPAGSSIVVEAGPVTLAFTRPPMARQPPMLCRGGDQATTAR